MSCLVDKEVEILLSDVSSADLNLWVILYKKKYNYKSLVYLIFKTGTVVKLEFLVSFYIETRMTTSIISEAQKLWIDIQKKTNYWAVL